MSQQSTSAPTKGSGSSGMSTSTLLSRLPLICRGVELCLAIMVLGLIIDPINARLQYNVNHAALTYVAFAGYILINGVLIISEMVGEPLPKTAVLLFTFFGGALFLSAGSVILNDWRNLFYTMHFHPPKMYMDMMLTSGILAIFNAFFFFADMGLTIRYALAAVVEAREAAADEEAAAAAAAAGPSGRGQGQVQGVSEEQQTDLADFAM